MSREAKLRKKISKYGDKQDGCKAQLKEILTEKEKEAQKATFYSASKDQKGKKKKKQKVKKEEERKKASGEERKEKDAAKLAEMQLSYAQNNPLLYTERKVLKEFLAPDAVDPNNYGYVKLQDAGRDVYVRTCYVDELPKNVRFANTFTDLFNFPNAMAQVRIVPQTSEESIKLVDKQVTDFDTERSMAAKSGDRNSYRKADTKLANAEGWGRDIESGDNRFYETSFMFQSHAETLEELNTMGNDLYSKARGKDVKVVSCYGVEPEAYKSGFPTNRIFRSKSGPVKTDTVKTQLMDVFSLSTIFNHTRSSFYHKNGVFMGRVLDTGKPVTLDPFDVSMEAYNIIVSGKTGTGKSASVKMLLSRSADFGLKYCSVDSEARGKQGEYSILTKKLGGENFQIHAGSNEIVNLFEISSEMEYDETRGVEEETLHLTERISIVKGILMTMLKYGKREPAFDDATAMESIVEEIIAHLYDIRGIRDGEPDSLYANSGFTKVKKPLPTITEFYIETLKRQKVNINEFHTKAYALILDGLKSYVRELYYVPKIVRILTKEEYEKLPMDEDGYRYYENGDERIMAISIKGVRAYYDGQSTIKVDLDTPAVNLDISQMPKNDMPIGMVIATNFLNENIIKKNSANPKRLQKRAILIDEAHRMFPYPELRVFLTDLYRSARKRYIAAICCTQALSDFKLYEETKTIVQQSPMIFLLRQDAQDREYLAEATPLSPGQLMRLFQLGGTVGKSGSVAKKGQVCMIINKNVAFVQMDYLKNTEIEVVETDMQKIDEYIRNKKRGQAHADAY